MLCNVLNVIDAIRRKFLHKHYTENMKNKVSDSQGFFIFNKQLLFYNLIVLTLHITLKQDLIEESKFGWQPQTK